MTLPRKRNTAIFGFVALSLTLGAACSSDPEPAPGGGGGSGGAGGSAAGANTAGTNVIPPGGTGPSTGGGGSGSGGTVSVGGGGTGTGGMTAGGTGGGTAGGSGGAGGAGTAGSSGAGGSGGSGGSGGGKVPMCITSKVEDGVDRAANNYIECDVEEQAIDFDVMAAYGANRKPGYDPSTTPISFTDFGTAFTGSAAQECHPYCYKGNATLGIEVVAGTESSLKGEVLFAFPNTVAPIADASGRNSLGWVFLDGPALPAGAKVTVQMVLKSGNKPTVLGNGTHDVTIGKWIEFKYFPIQQGFQAADLMGVTHIGFRMTITGTTQAWSGVMYADHFQLRK
jgi:hypothetical protein